jgi:hypothetical protein
MEGPESISGHPSYEKVKRGLIPADSVHPNFQLLRPFSDREHDTSDPEKQAFWNAAVATFSLEGC